MKRTLLSLFAATAVVSIAALPIFSANAEGRGGRLAEELNLSAAQQEQVDALREQTRSQIQNVLTPEQQATVEAAIANGENPRRALRSLSLTEDQRTEMREIKDSKRTAMQDILTPEQRAQFEEMRGSRRGGNKGDRLKEGGKGGGIERLAQELNLTDAQVSQIEAMREDAKAQMQNILTADQRATVEAAIANGENPRRAMRSLDLTEDQRAEMRELKESKRAQIESILTPDQLEQFQQMRESRRGGRGQSR